MNDFKPLGPPKRQEPAKPPEWVATDRPGVERSVITGRLRTSLPLPPIHVPVQPVWPFKVDQADKSDAVLGDC